MSNGRLDALVAREGKDGKTHWTKVGAAFPNRDGGYSVVLDALPLDGKIVLKQPRERQQREPGDDREEDRPSW